MIVFDAESRTVTYCDSLGRAYPTDFEALVDNINTIFFKSNPCQNIIYAHSPFESVDQDMRHVCRKDVCAKYYPLQKSGNVCGVVVMICAVIATFRYEIFQNIIDSSPMNLHELKALQNFSRYSAFYRSVVLKWIVSNEIRMEDFLKLNPKR